MSTRLGLSICGVLFALLLGCKSYGPKFDSNQKSLDAYAQEKTQAHYPSSTNYPAFTNYLAFTNFPGSTNFPVSTNLDQQLFSLVELTNDIRPDWLKPPTNFFKLGPGDVIEIEVLGEPTPRSTALLGPDGKLYYDLLPGLSVWGLTLSETKELLENELAKFNRFKPELILTLRTVASIRVWILGGVQAPGVYPISTPMTLLEAIATAGGTAATPGTTEEAVDLNRSFVMRQGRLLKVDFHSLLRRGDLSQNIYLEPDDFTYLRPATARYVYVLGAVGAPNLVPYSEEISLMSVLTTTGPPLPFAHLSHVAIVRGSLVHPSIAIVDYRQIIKGLAPDIRLESGDIVYVPLAPYREIAVFAQQILYQFVSTVAVNEGARAVLKNPAPVSPTIGLGSSPTK